jgi:hypothetical protein
LYISEVNQYAESVRLPELYSLYAAIVLLARCCIPAAQFAAT